MTELCSEKLSLNVDCLEFSNFDPSIFACGLYQLFENERKGGICLMKFQQETNSIKYLSTIESNGVFNVKWITDRPNLLSAEADGCLNVYDTVEDCFLKVSKNLSLTENMLLNLDITRTNEKFVASDNKGYLYHGVIENSSDIRLIDSWPVDMNQSPYCSNEVWCCSYSLYNNNILYSGSENCTWKVWDIRGDLKKPSLFNKFHKAGVVSVVPYPLDENCLFTGSYDDTVCVWDVRNIKIPTWDLNLGGGVWKVKFNPDQPSKILCACMYNGWAILKYDSNGGLSCELNKCIEEKLLYGVDWCPDNSSYFVCCTFYDNTVRLFKT